MDTTADMTCSSSAQFTVAISNFHASLFPGIWVLSLMNYVVILSAGTGFEPALPTVLRASVPHYTIGLYKRT